MRSGWREEELLGVTGEGRRKKEDDREGKRKGRGDSRKGRKVYAPLDPILVSFTS